MRRDTSIIVVLALAAAVAPRVASAGREWEEDYTDEWSDQRPPSSSYDVSVDVNDAGTASFDSFYAPLSSYGDWTVAGSYGRVWRPHVAAGWRPYYYGRWEWTDEGWLWVSDEPWGWAAYHYGRWSYDPGLGWFWVPGYQWAPAWVAWRYSGDAVGWAPLAPGLSVYVTSYPFAAAWWTFVPTGHFCSVPVYSVAYAPGYTRQYFYATAPAPPRPIAVPYARGGGVRPAPAPAWGGPAPRLIAERTGRPVAPVRIVPAATPGVARRGPGEVGIYRPDARPIGRPSPAPSAGASYRPSPGGAYPPGAAPAPDGPRSGYGPPSERGGGRPAMPNGGAAAPPARAVVPAPGGPRYENRGGGGYAPPRREFQAPAPAPGGGRGGGPAAFAPRGRGGAAPVAPRGGRAASAPVRGHR